MTEASPLDAAMELATLLDRACADERELLAERDRAMVAAVQAGARLSEVADAAMVSRAAVSLSVRKSLPPRTGRGGPYRSRRGLADALSLVTEAATKLVISRSNIHELRTRRDLAIAGAVAGGRGVRETARHLGMTAPTISSIVRVKS